MPLYCQISATYIDELLIKKLYIQVNDPDDHDLIDSIIEDLTEAINDSDVKIWE